MQRLDEVRRQGRPHEGETLWLRATLACALCSAPPGALLGGGRHGTRCQVCLALCSPQPGAVAPAGRDSRAPGLAPAAMTAAVDTHRCAVGRAHCYLQHAALTGPLLPLVSVLERIGRGSPLPAARRGVSPPRSPRRGVEYTVLTQWQHDEPQGRGEEEDSEEPALEVRPVSSRARCCIPSAAHDRPCRVCG